jgi:chaperone required for assembly of F1-ATPase
MTPARRFWTAAAIVPHADGWAVTLDGKTALTPARAALATRHKRLADAVAAEWAAAGATVEPQAMPLTGFLNAVIDRVRPERGTLGASVAAFAQSDAICYRAERPDDLIARQAAGWDPVLSWLERRHGARLIRGTGVLPVAQAPEALTRLAQAVAALDAYRLAATLKMSGMFKSLALTLAAIEGERGVLEAYDLSRIDETYQAEHWGEDAEAARRVARDREELRAAAAFLAALDGENGR